MNNRDTSRHFALAPAGYLHLEQAVYRLAQHENADLWRDKLPDTQLYERLGASLHIEDLDKAIKALWGTHELRSRFQDRLEACAVAERTMREHLRQARVPVVYQRRSDGKVLPFDADWWAQKTAPAWFLDGSCFLNDTTMIGSNKDIVNGFGLDLPEDRGFYADLFVEEAGLGRLLQGDTSPTSKPEPVQPIPSSRDRRGRPANKLHLIEQALRAEHPDGPPVWFDREELRSKVELRTGKTISLSSLDRARRSAWKR